MLFLSGSRVVLHQCNAQTDIWPLAARWFGAVGRCLLDSQTPACICKPPCRQAYAPQKLHSSPSKRRPRVVRHPRSSPAAWQGVSDPRQEPPVTEKFLWDSDTVGNSTGVQFITLGTSGHGNARHRAAPATILRWMAEVWLFECGEDTQRQFLRQPLLRPSKLSRIFVSCADLDNILGLPGMLCTVSSSREIGFESTDVPVHIYGPPGLALYLRSMLQVSDTFLAMPIIVHEFVQHAVPEEELAVPRSLDQRSCLFLQRIPPDQLHPEGYSDGTMTPFLQRRNRGNRRKGPDERLAVRPISLPPPGDVSRTDVAPADMTWTVSCGTDFAFKAALLPHPSPCWCFFMEEAARVGALDPVRCRELGVLPGEAFSQLKSGISVLNQQEQLVHSHQVLHSDRPGRKLAVIGPGTDSLAVSKHAEDADVVVHSARRLVQKADGSHEVQCSASMPGKFAQAAQAHQLILTGFPDSIPPNTPLSIEERLIAFPASASASNGVPMPSSDLEWDLAPAAAPVPAGNGALPQQQPAASSGCNAHPTDSARPQQERQPAGVASTPGRQAPLRSGLWGRPALQGHSVSRQAVRRAGAQQRSMARMSVVACDSPWHHWPRKNEQQNARQDIQSQRKRGNASDKRLQQRAPGKGGHNPNKLRRRTREDHERHQEMVAQRKARQQPQKHSARAQETEVAAFAAEADFGKMIYTHVPHASQIVVMGHKSPELQALIHEAETAFLSGKVIAAQDFHLLEIRRRQPPPSESSNGADISTDVIWHLK